MFFAPGLSSEEKIVKLCFIYKIKNYQSMLYFIHNTLYIIQL